MYPFHKILSGLLILFLCSSCSSDNNSDIASQSHFQQSEYIYRLHNDSFCSVPPALPQAPTPYPWNANTVGTHQKITKEFFRCRGSSLNPVRSTQEKGSQVLYADCGGSEKHSLPLRDQKEFIYPILIDLLNHIQAKSGKRVVITSGHRCPDHNVYVDSSTGNSCSKHMIGAEVSFYVQNMESKPEAIVKYIQEFYKQSPKYQGQKEFLEFKRYDKADSGVSTPPWFNKEIFVKLYKPKEGRNFDNRHPYPYFSIQVRYDMDKQEKVVYSWEKGNRNYMRY